jgi:ABC-2 type transport system permease protein
VVAQLLRLRLTLLANSFRRRPARLFGMILALAYLLALGIMLTAALAGLGSTTPGIARSVLTVVGSLVIGGAVLLPFVFGIDDPLDPRRFALFGMRPGRLALDLAIAAAASLPALLVATLAIVQVTVWAHHGATFVAVVAAILIVPTCVLAARVATALASSLFTSHRWRETTGILLLSVLAVAAPLVAFLAVADWQGYGLPMIRRLGAALAWTPLGAAWSAPGDAALGHPETALAKLALSFGGLLLLALAWRVLVGALLVRRPRERVVRMSSRLGWFEALPDSPLGAIAARSLSYWGRDARYRVALAIIPVVPVFMVVALLVAGVPGEFVAWIPVPVMCLFLGWNVHNDVAHDSTAFWAHVSASTRGSDDRWGRIIPPLFVGVPLALVGSAVTVTVTGAVETLPGLLGLSLCVLFVSLGVSSFVSAAFPYPAVRPGDSPFAQPQAMDNSSSGIQSLSLLVSIVLSAPVAALLVLMPELPDLQYIALGGGLALGLPVLLGGVYWGGHIVNRRAPELLAFTLQN